MQNIALCGFMGSGKSTVGRQLAEKKGLVFLDTDALIEQAEAMSIPDIFRLHGEPYFRDLETALCEELVKVGGQLISLGGGTLDRPENVRILKDSGCLILFLNTPFEVCWQRIQNDPHRPVAAGKSKEELKALYDKRRAIYMAAADMALYDTK